MYYKKGIRFEREKKEQQKKNVEPKSYFLPDGNRIF